MAFVSQPSEEPRAGERPKGSRSKANSLAKRLVVPILGSLAFVTIGCLALLLYRGFTLYSVRSYVDHAVSQRSLDGNAKTYLNNHRGDATTHLLGRLDSSNRDDAHQITRLLSRLALLELYEREPLLQFVDADFPPIHPEVPVIQSNDAELLAGEKAEKIHVWWSRVRVTKAWSSNWLSW